MTHAHKKWSKKSRYRREGDERHRHLWGKWEIAGSNAAYPAPLIEIRSCLECHVSQERNQKS